MKRFIGNLYRFFFNFISITFKFYGGYLVLIAVVILGWLALNRLVLQPVESSVGWIVNAFGGLLHQLFAKDAMTLEVYKSVMTKSLKLWISIAQGVLCCGWGISLFLMLFLLRFLEKKREEKKKEDQLRAEEALRRAAAMVEEDDEE